MYSTNKCTDFNKNITLLKKKKKKKKKKNTIFRKAPPSIVSGYGK
jgi:hypothetical protein